MDNPQPGSQHTNLASSAADTRPATTAYDIEGNVPGETTALLGTSTQPHTAQSQHLESPPTPYPRIAKAMRSLAALLLISLVIGSIYALAAAPHSHRSDGNPTSGKKSSSSPAAFLPYTAPSAFPTKAFSDGYYLMPGDFTAEPRPIITNIIDDSVFPDSLDDPHNLPTGAPASEAVYPRPSASPTPGMKKETLQKIQAIIEDTTSGATNCSKCTKALKVGQALVRAEPHSGPELMVSLCKQYHFQSTKSGLTQDEICEREYAPSTLGAQYTSILSYANLSDVDGQAICASVFSACTAPPPSTLTKNFVKKWFKGHSEAPKNLSKKTGKPLEGKRKGETLKVAHLSDLHVDPRYLVGAEAACTSGQCCRSDSFNSSVASTFKGGLNSSTTVNPAGYWGEYTCDPPWSIAVSALDAVTPLNGGKDVDMTIHTGDMVSLCCLERVQQAETLTTSTS